MVALKNKHGACAALLNPTSAEPLVWPSPLKFISELNQDAKALLEQALMEANREREKSILKGTSYSLPSPSHSDVAIDDNVSEVIFQPSLPYQSIICYCSKKIPKSWIRDDCECLKPCCSVQACPCLFLS